MRVHKMLGGLVASMTICVALVAGQGTALAQSPITPIGPFSAVSSGVSFAFAIPGGNPSTITTTCKTATLPGTIHETLPGSTKTTDGSPWFVTGGKPTFGGCTTSEFFGNGGSTTVTAIAETNFNGTAPQKEGLSVVMNNVKLHFNIENRCELDVSTSPWSTSNPGVYPETVSSLQFPPPGHTLEAVVTKVHGNGLANCSIEFKEGTTKGLVNGTYQLSPVWTVQSHF